MIDTNKISKESLDILEKLAKDRDTTIEDILDKSALLLPQVMALLDVAKEDFDAYKTEFRKLIPSEDGFYGPMEFKDFTGHKAEEAQDIKQQLRGILAAAYVSTLSEEDLQFQYIGGIIESAVAKKV